MKKLVTKLFYGTLLMFSGVGLVASSVTGSITLKAELEKRVLTAGSRQDALIRITVCAPAVSRDDRNKARVNLTVVLDRSGSMGTQKLGKAKEATISALNMLREGDIFSLVVYDTNVQTIVPATEISAAVRDNIISQIRSITSGGSTALFAGVSTGANEIRKNSGANYVNRIILLSDGLANVGPSSPQELGRLGASFIKENISVSTIGVGSDYNEDLMTALSQNSDGNFYFVENSRDLPLIFSKELGSALKVAAKSINVKIVCPDGIKPKGILGHECRINGNTIDINFNQVYSGHEKSLILQVEVPPQPDGASSEIAKVELDYSSLDGKNRFSRHQRVNASYSSSEKKVYSNINRAVQAEAAVQKSNVMREKAVQEADRGNYDRAKQILNKAASDLKKVSKETKNKELEVQAQKLEDREQDIQESKDNQAKYKTVRKRIKGESYQIRNDQIYQQQSK